MNTEDFYGGTTILAVEFDGGVVLGADSRTSCRGYVANRMANKVTRITDHIYCCRSGSAAQTQALADIVKSKMKHLHYILKQPGLVRDAAVQFRNMIYDRRNEKMVSVIVAGWDERLGGQVYAVPPSGLLLREKFSIGGTGGTYIQGYVQSHYSPGMSQEDAVDLVSSAIKLAIARDCISGGIVRIVIITKNGMNEFILYTKDNDVIKESNKTKRKLVFGEH